MFWLVPMRLLLKVGASGEGSVVAAGAIVTQDVPDNVVVAGVPCACYSKQLDGKTQQKRLL